MNELGHSPPLIYMNFLQNFTGPDIVCLDICFSNVTKQLKTILAERNRSYITLVV